MGICETVQKKKRKECILKHYRCSCRRLGVMWLRQQGRFQGRWSSQQLLTFQVEEAELER